jgi:phi13 family phage major tail protein
MSQIYEYRGVSGLVYAKVTKDDKTGYATGTVKPLAGVAEISKSTESSNEPHYYDNIPAVVVSSTGSDEIAISASAIPFDVLADITGQYYDSATGMYVEKERTPGTAKTESCAVVCIDKDTRTIHTIPYGIGEKRTIEY